MLENRHSLNERIVGVFRLDEVLITQLFTDVFGLAAFSGTVRTGVDFNQSNNIRFVRFNERCNQVSVVFGFLEETGIGKGDMVPVPVAGSISDII